MPEDKNADFVNLMNLAATVRNMRYAQKKYFSTRDANQLKRSKELEKEVDKIVDDILSPQTKIGL
jgi:ATP-dependent Zn protease